jgi:hypothetical protein
MRNSRVDSVLRSSDLTSDTQVDRWFPQIGSIWYSSGSCLLTRVWIGATKTDRQHSIAATSGPNIFLHALLFQ